MDHYRLSTEHSGLPFPALAIRASDLGSVEALKELGFERGSALVSGEVEIPHVPFAFDLHDEKSVGVFSTNRRDYLVQYDFPDDHGAWADKIHLEQQALLCASPSDFLSYSTIGESIADSFFGRVVLSVRATAQGVGTRRAT